MALYGEPLPRTKLLLSIFQSEFEDLNGLTRELQSTNYCPENQDTFPMFFIRKSGPGTTLKDVLGRIEKAIANDADVVREKDINGRAPLHLACSVASPGQIDVIKTLCSAKKANVNVLDTMHRTPLHHALSPSNMEFYSTTGRGESLISLVRLLLEKGASPSALDIKGVTPLHLALDFHRSGYAGKLQELPAILEILKQSGADMSAIAYTYSFRAGADVPIRSSSSPIHLACRMNGPQSLAAVKFLLNPGTINCIDSLGRTPLHIAILSICRFPRPTAFFRDMIFNSDSDFVTEKIDILLNSGADVNVEDADGMTPLLTAIELYNYEPSASIVKTLLCNGAIATKRDRERRTTPLHSACRYYDRSLPELLPYFIKAGGRLNVTDYKMFTPFHYALYKKCCSVDTLRNLVDAGANATAVDGQNNNSIHILCSHRQANFKSTVAFLIEKGCSIEHVNKHGNTPLLHLLQSEYSGESVQALIDLGADCRVFNSESVSPLHLVCRSVAPSRGSVDLVKSMISAGADVNARDRSMSTPLFYAVKDEPTVDEDVVLLLLLAGANPNMANDDMCMTPLHVVCSYGNFELAKMLIAFGGNVNQVNSKGNTPLHEAVQAKAGDARLTCQFLVEAGANVAARNYQGCTPFAMLDEHRSNSYRFLVGRVVQLVYLQKYKLCRKELTLLEHSKSLAKHYADCFSCVRAMKSHRLGNSCVTLWTFLLAPSGEARRYAKNPKIVKDLYSIADSGMKFRTYASTIKDKTVECERFVAFSKRALDSFLQIFHESNLPLIAAEKIISYLNEYEMKSLIMATFTRQI